MSVQRSAWETVSATLTIDDVEEFAIRLKGLGTDFGYPPLVALGDQLATNVGAFDMDGIRDSLSEFPDMIDAIQLVSA